MSFISRLRRSRQHRVSILSAYLVHPFPLRGTSPQGETRALRDNLSLSSGMIRILVISRCAAPPYPAAPDFPPSGGQNKTPRAHSRHFDESEAEWRNLTSLMVQAALRWEISRLSVSSEWFPPAPIPACGSARDDDPGGQHWTRLRCEGSKGGGIVLSGDEFYRPPSEARPFHHWRGPPPPASRGRQVCRGAVSFTPAREYP